LEEKEYTPYINTLTISQFVLVTRDDNFDKDANILTHRKKLEESDYKTKGSSEVVLFCMSWWILLWSFILKM